MQNSMQTDGVDVEYSVCETRNGSHNFTKSQ